MQKLLSNHNLFMLRLFLTLLGAFIASVYSHSGHDYWLLMMFLFSLLSVLPGYYHTEESARNSKIFSAQVLHWSGGLCAAITVYAYHSSGRIFHEEAGLIVLLILALTTYLEGIRTGWRSCFAGAFLALSAICIAYFDNYIWQLTALAAMAVLFSHFMNSDITMPGQSSHHLL